MKKSIILIPFLLTAALSFSQQKEKVKFGIQAGINVSNIRGKLNSTGISYSFSPIIGLNAGGLVEVPIGKGFYARVEPSFSQLGAKQYPVSYDYYGDMIPYDSASQGLTVKSTLSYIVLPVLLKYRIANTGFGILAGGQYGLLVRASDKVSNKAKSILLNAKDDYDKHEFSLIAGAEYCFPIGIGLSARYQHGLNNIQPATRDIGTVKHQAFIFLVNYRF